MPSNLNLGIFASDKIPLVQMIAHQGQNYCLYRANAEMYHSPFVSTTLCLQLGRMLFRPKLRSFLVTLHQH